MKLLNRVSRLACDASNASSRSSCESWNSSSLRVWSATNCRSCSISGSRGRPNRSIHCESSEFTARSMFFALSSRSRGSLLPKGLPVLNLLISIIRLSVVVNVLLGIICDCHQIYPILAGRANLTDDARRGQALAYTKVKVGVVWSRVEAERSRYQHLLGSDIFSIEYGRQGAVIAPQRYHMLLSFLPVEDVHGFKDAASEGFDDARLRPARDLVDEVHITTISAVKAR